MTQVYITGHPTPELSVCIPTFDAGQPRLSQILDALLDHTSVPYEVVVVDCEQELRGYTVPQNEAMAAAHGKWLLALNDDVLVCPDWIEPLLQPLQRGAWCVTPDQTHTDGPQIFAPYCMLWDSAAWRGLGGLDEQFGWWCSDIDIAKRAVDAGHQPVRVKLPAPGITHAGGETSTGPHQHELIEMSLHDMTRFQRKWGITAEQMKHRLAELVPPC